jgi:adenylate cyclase
VLAGVIDERLNIETNVGLATLFRVRGPRTPPDEVVIVAMDEKSDVNRTGGDFTQWRQRHAGLIEQLHQQGAALIVFDLYYNDAQPANDPALAAAMRQAGNVLATDCIQTALNAWIECGNQAGPLANDADSSPIFAKVVKVNPPTPALADALLDHAPFFLSNDPDNPTLSQSWGFVDEHVNLPTLPVLTWFYYLDYQSRLPLYFASHRPLSRAVSHLRAECFNNSMRKIRDPAEAESTGAKIERVLCQQQQVFLDFYGPPKTLPTYSYNDVIDADTVSLQGKVVFVGQTSRRQADSFLTPFTDTVSGRMVGVEIMATQFANLLENRSIQTPVALGWCMLAYGISMALLLSCFPGLVGILISLLLSLAYAGVAVVLFTESGLWLPVAVPVLLQLPLTGFAALYWSRRDQQQEAELLKDKIDLMTSENERLVHQFIEQAKQSKSLTLSVSGENLAHHVSGVCLVSDIEGFTALAEATSPYLLIERLREYFNLLSGIVSQHGGKVVNIAGDGMVAIWENTPTRQYQQAACFAAIDMQKKIKALNDNTNHPPLITRIGLHEGEFAMGSFIGNTDENPFGDTINTASRIEGANKLLGTRVLASRSVVEQVPNLLFRPVGNFLLLGKHAPSALVEIFGVDVEQKKIAILSKQFNHALIAFSAGDWRKAKTYFQRIVNRYGDDGPSMFYIETIGALDAPPSDWQGYIILETK